MPDVIPLEFRDKRRILHAKGMDRRRLEIAGALVRAGRLAESLEYLERSKDGGLLGEVRGGAVAAGDVFTLVRVCQILRVEPDPPEWRELAAAAERLERFYDAVNALERAGDQERADALRVQRCPEFRPFKPTGK